MVDVNLDLDDISGEESTDMAALSASQSASEIDARRRLEKKLEETRLKKLMNEYDFDF